LREKIRKELGLNDNDMLVISLSSINPGKGQLLFLESANSVIENESFQEHDKKKQNSSQVTLARRYHIRKLLPMLKDSNSISRFVWSLLKLVFEIVELYQSSSSCYRYFKMIPDVAKF
jgi:hypothetical protein